VSEYLTTKELAELLRIKERKVYDLAASGSVPCSRATGKLLFPRAAVHAWLAEHGSGGAELAKLSIPQVFLGSHDPLLEWTLRESQSGIATYFDGSIDGLDRFILGGGIATGLHVHDNESDRWNIPLVEKRCATMPVILVEWAKRSRGLIVNPALKSRITTLECLKNVRFVARQPGAGSQQNLLQLLEDSPLEYSEIDVVSVARTEHDAALSVLEGEADAAFGLESVALQYKLEYRPLVVERFDLLVRRKTWFEPEFQRFLEFRKTPAFKQKASSMAGYDCTGFGRIHFNGPDY